MKTQNTNASPAAKAGQHTPTPWRITGTDAAKDFVRISIQSRDKVIADVVWSKWNPNLPDQAQGEANANLIVRAVNSHEMLVAALRDVLAEADFGDTELESRCRAALAAAEGRDEA